MGSIPGSGRSPGEGNGNPLQYSCLGSPMDRAKCWGYSPRGHKRVRHNSVEQWGFKGSWALSKEVSVWGSGSMIWGAKMNSLMREEAKPTQETRETQVWSLGQNSLEEGMAAHSSVAWRLPSSEEPGGLQPVLSQSRTRLQWLSSHAQSLVENVPVQARRDYKRQTESVRLASLLSYF